VTGDECVRYDALSNHKIPPQKTDNRSSGTLWDSRTYRGAFVKGYELVRLKSDFAPADILPVVAFRAELRW